MRISIRFNDLSVMKYAISFLLAIGLLGCGGLDLEQDYLVSELHEVIDQADQKLDNPTTAKEWEPIEKEFQAISTQVREEYDSYEPPIQHRFDSLQNYFKAQRQAYLDKVAQIETTNQAPANNMGNDADGSDTNENATNSEESGGM